MKDTNLDTRKDPQNRRTAMAKVEQHQAAFFEQCEKVLDSNLPWKTKIEVIEALYVAYCTAVGKKPII